MHECVRIHARTCASICTNVCITSIHKCVQSFCTDVFTWNCSKCSLKLAGFENLSGFSKCPLKNVLSVHLTWPDELECTWESFGYRKTQDMPPLGWVRDILISLIFLECCPIHFCILLLLKMFFTIKSLIVEFPLILIAIAVFHTLLALFSKFQITAIQSGLIYMTSNLDQKD